MTRPNLGFGIGLRVPHYGTILERGARVDWFEVISENFMVAGGRPLHVLERVRRDFPIALHGVSLSIGSTDPLDRSYLRELRDLAKRFEPAWISDHLCWTGVGGHNLHDLLPLPWNEETLGHVCARVREVQDVLGRRLVLENVSSYLTFSHSTMSEWEFIVELAARADCDLLLDVNNVYVSAYNHRFDALAYLRAIPVERVAQIHLAGHTDCVTHLLDTHDAPVADPVWELYRDARRRFGRVSTLIEWDGDVPSLERVEDEALLARAIASEVDGEATSQGADHAHATAAP